MKKIIILSAIVALFASCTVETKKEFKGYRFQKEYAASDSVKNSSLTKDLTIDMYVMLHEYPNYSWTNIFTKMKSDRECEFCFRVRDSKAGQFYFGNGSLALVLSFNTKELFKLNNWHRVTLVRDMKKRELRIYADGDLKGKQQFRRGIKASALTNSPIYVAGINKRRGDMTIADVKIWNKAMTDSEILKGWGEIKNPESEKSLVAYWSFEDLVERQIENLAGSELTLTIKKK